MRGGLFCTGKFNVSLSKRYVPKNLRLAFLFPLPLSCSETACKHSFQGLEDFTCSFKM